jgi:hypothetical protein
MNTNPDKLAQAREWAKYGKPGHQPETVAAAEVINALPDEWIDADDLREALDWIDSKPFGDDYDGEFYDRLRALLPAPTPRTLADLSKEERHAHVWKDVHVEGWDNPSVLVAVYKDEGAVLGHNWIQQWPFVEVRPLAELTPVEPTSEPVTENTPDHPTELTTPADYQNAPAGTVVAAEGEEAWTKNNNGFWETFGIISGYNNYGMAGEARQVLRRGWEA